LLPSEIAWQFHWGALLYPLNILPSRKLFTYLRTSPFIAQFTEKCREQKRAREGFYRKQPWAEIGKKIIAEAKHHPLPRSHHT